MTLLLQNNDRRIMKRITYMFLNSLFLASLTLACSREGGYLTKEYENGLLISPIDTVTEYSKLRITAAKNADGGAAFPVLAQFASAGKTGELIYDVCSSNGLLRMSSCRMYVADGSAENSTSITGEVSIIERPGSDAMGAVISMTREMSDRSLMVCELDVGDKVKFGDSIEVLWPRLIDCCHLTETRTGYLDDDERKIVFSVAAYSGKKSDFVFLYAVYDYGGVPFGWGMVEGTDNLKLNLKLDVRLRRYGETDKYDVQVQESNGKLLLNLSVGRKTRSFSLQSIKCSG